MQNENQKQIERSRRLNANRTYIYTDGCTFCGRNDDWADLSTRLKNLGKNVFARQTLLFAGWGAEADEIGLTLPFVYDCDTGQAITVAEGNAMTDEELKDWLNALDQRSED